jgi:hypothetical protein
MPFSFPSSPTIGQYSRQNNRVYKWNGYSWDLFYNNLTVSVLVVGGGGAGGSGGASSNAGAGGGGGAVIEQTVNVVLDVPLNVTIAAGAAGSVTNGVRSNFGNASIFDRIVAIGGGSGGINDNNGSLAPIVRPGGHGANGGGRNGSGNEYLGLSMIPGGFNGGSGDGYNGGGGGGGGSRGGGVSGVGPAGGNGKVATINGVTYGGGGSACCSGTAGGSGGGGRGSLAGSPNVNPEAGSPNTGGGGGGAINPGTATGLGGSGVVVLRFDATLTITLSAGLTHSVAFVDNEEIVTITQGTGTVTFTA